MCKYLHRDTRGRSPRSPGQLLQSVCLKLWVRRSLPRTLNHVYGFHEFQVVFEWLLKQTAGMKTKMVIKWIRANKQSCIQMNDNHWKCNVIYEPAAAEWFVIWPWWDWFHLLPNKTSPVISQDIVDPPWQGLITVAGHLRAILSVLKV